MIATVNTFPPLHALNSPRSWFLVLIALLHLGFFWALTHGVSIGGIHIEPKTIMELLPDAPRPPPPPSVVEVEPNVISRLFVPVVDPPVLRHEDAKPPIQVTSEPQPVPEPVVEKPGSGPLIIEPVLDARFPLTEPEYPVAEIRQGHEGTVWLSLQILPNGRVGAVRIDESSGFVKLDESAAREARRWRMKPGTSDGAATAMWKRVPIRFQLKNGR
jgi:periplasmic protein TonB